MGLKDYLRNDTNNSAMRLMAFLAVLTGCIFALMTGLAVLLAVILLKEPNTIIAVSAIIGAILGGGAAVIGALFLPAFGGKAAQSFAEGPENGTHSGDENEPH